MHPLEQYYTAKSKQLRKKGYTYCGSGWSRECFLSPNEQWVVKIPKNKQGIYCNKDEYSLWLSRERNPSRFDPRLARCKLMRDNLLVMESLNIGDKKLIDFLSDYDNIQSNPWLHEIDRYQVGINRKGQMVAFDYPELSEDAYSLCR